MQLDRRDSGPITTAPERTFTGDVTISGYFRRPEPSRLAGATVTFPPGARTSWKLNPAGQTVIITSGVGWAQSSGAEIVELRAGDVAWFAPGERHWEGATPEEAMTCVVLHESTVEFLDEVTDDQYRSGPPTPQAQSTTRSAPAR